MTAGSRVLIVSADVAGGHDAAARALTARLIEANPRTSVQTRNGLADMGAGAHRFVRDGYGIQLKHAQWTYRLVYALTTTRVGAAMVRIMTWLVASRLERVVRESGADLVISTYPLCTAPLGRLRSTGRISARVVATVTDPDPHRLWFAPGVDVHVLATAGDVDRAHRLVPWAPVTSCAPLVAPECGTRIPEWQARRAFQLPQGREIVLVSGGAWGVGGLERLVRRLSERTSAHVVVACGRNDELRAHLANRFAPGDVTALEFTSAMPTLLHAVDVVVATGPGMTVLEALACDRPVVMAQPIPGHGVRSAKALHEDGIAVLARRRSHVARVVQAALADGSSRGDSVLPVTDPVVALSHVDMDAATRTRLRVLRDQRRRHQIGMRHVVAAARVPLVAAALAATMLVSHAHPVARQEMVHDARVAAQHTVQGGAQHVRHVGHRLR